MNTEEFEVLNYLSDVFLTELKSDIYLQGKIDILKSLACR
jgi:hypothetical protein